MTLSTWPVTIFSNLFLNSYNYFNVSQWSIDMCHFLLHFPGVYIFLRGGGGKQKKRPTGLGKKWLKGDKKGGKMHILSQIGERYAFFSPYRLKYTKLQKKGWQFIACGAHPLIIKIKLGRKYKSRRGGQKYESQF